MVEFFKSICGISGVGLAVLYRIAAGSIVDIAAGAAIVDFAARAAKRVKIETVFSCFLVVDSEVSLVVKTWPVEIRA